MKIGPYSFDNCLALAPMAGVTDRPFRQMCRKFGASLLVSEMTSSNPKLRHTRQSQLRMNHLGEPSPIIVQIVGSDPDALADAARYNVEMGADIIDINMGCPAKKVCNQVAGSALLSNEPLVDSILKTVIRSVDVPVTLKIRTGPSMDNRNACTIAKIAQDNGIAALAIHGRTRACKFLGSAEYDTIADVKSKVSIPVIANGDIDSAETARDVLKHTRVDGLMIGRAAQGNPWIFRQINHFLNTGCLPDAPSSEEIRTIMLDHLSNLYDFYGDLMGVRIAKKHISWYLKKNGDPNLIRPELLRATEPQEQYSLVECDLC